MVQLYAGFHQAGLLDHIREVRVNSCGLGDICALESTEIFHLSPAATKAAASKKLFLHHF